MNSNDPEQLNLENQYRNAKDVNELITIARNNYVKTNQLSADFIPLDDEAAFDLITGFICNWILLCGQLPMDSRERLIETVQSLIDGICNFQSKLSADPSLNINQDILHLLKRALIGPGKPLY